MAVLAELHQARQGKLKQEAWIPPRRTRLNANAAASEQGWSDVRVTVTSILVPLSTIAGTLQAHPKERLDQDRLGGLVYSAGEGNRLILGAGVWRIFNPDAAGLEVVIFDLADPAAAAFYGGTRLNGGTADTRAAAPTQLTMAAALNVTVGVASGVALAAQPTARYIYIRNVSAAGQVISLSWLGAAQLNFGVTLNVNDWVCFEVPEATPLGAMEAISSAAAGKLAIQVGT